MNGEKEADGGILMVEETKTLNKFLKASETDWDRKGEGTRRGGTTGVSKLKKRGKELTKRTGKEKNFRNSRENAPRALLAKKKLKHEYPKPAPRMPNKTGRY